MGSIKKLLGYYSVQLVLNLSDLITITIISIVVLLFILLLYKELFILSFDEEYSKVINIPKWIQFYL